MGSCAASTIDESYKIWMGYIGHDTRERDVIEHSPHTHTHTHRGRRVSVSNTLFYLLDCLYDACKMYHTVNANKTVFLKMNLQVQNM